MARDAIHTNDRQLACARINSKEGQDYLVRNRPCRLPCCILRTTRALPRLALIARRRPPWRALQITRG